MSTPRSQGVVKRFLDKMKDPAHRQLFYNIFGAKLIGLSILFLAISVIPAYFSSSAHAG